MDMSEAACKSSVFGNNASFTFNLRASFTAQGLVSRLDNRAQGLMRQPQPPSRPRNAATLLFQRLLDKSRLILQDRLGQREAFIQLRPVQFFSDKASTRTQACYILRVLRDLKPPVGATIGVIDFYIRKMLALFLDH